MNRRITLGFAADAAETCALTMADPNATERILAACDGYRDDGDWSHEMHNVVETVRYHLGNKHAKVAYAYFHHRPWRKTGMKKATFYKMLKKVKLFLTPENIGRKRRHTVRRLQKS